MDIERIQLSGSKLPVETLAYEAASLESELRRAVSVLLFIGLLAFGCCLLLS